MAADPSAGGDAVFVKIISIRGIPPALMSPPTFVLTVTANATLGPNARGGGGGTGRGGATTIRSGLLTASTAADAGTGAGGGGGEDTAVLRCDSQPYVFPDITAQGIQNITVTVKHVDVAGGAGAAGGKGLLDDEEEAFFNEPESELMRAQRLAQQNRDEEELAIGYIPISLESILGAPEIEDEEEIALRPAGPWQKLVGPEAAAEVGLAKATVRMYYTLHDRTRQDADGDMDDLAPASDLMRIGDGDPFADPADQGMDPRLRELLEEEEEQERLEGRLKGGEDSDSDSDEYADDEKADEEEDGDGDGGERRRRQRQPNVVELMVLGVNTRCPPTSLIALDVRVGRGKKVKNMYLHDKKTPTPKMKFLSKLPNTDPTSVVYLRVHTSHKGGRRTFVGQARVTVTEILAGGRKLDAWLPMMDSTWSADQRLGRIHINARWIYDKVSAEEKEGILGKWGNAMSTLASATGGLLGDNDEIAGQGLNGDDDDEDDDDDDEESRGLFGRKKKKKKAVEKRKAYAGPRRAFAGDDTDSDEAAAKEEAEEQAARNRAAGVLPEQDEEQQALEEEIRAQEALAVARAEEAEERLAALKPGGYQLQVHVIEARDLKGENLSGTSDPVVRISCMGEEHHTTVVKDVTSAVYDETLFFQWNDLSPEDIYQATISIRVYDYNTFLRDALIGMIELDFAHVYALDGHSLYRAWLPLTDNEDEGDAGVQGNLRVSITILGPGDKMQHRTEDKEDEGGDEEQQDSLALFFSPSAKTQLRFLVITIVAIDDFLTTTNLLDRTRASAKLRFRADFCGNVNVHTSAASSKATLPLRFTVGQELWLPVMEPAMARHVRLTLLEQELTGRTAIARALFEYRELRRVGMKGKKKRKKKKKKKKKHRDSAEGADGENPDEEDKGGFLSDLLSSMGVGERDGALWPGDWPLPEWVPLYGPPPEVRATRSKASMQVGETTSASASGVSISSKKWARIMAEHGNVASAYRGRALIALRVISRPDAKMGNRPFRSEVPPALVEELRASVDETSYTLRAQLFQATEVPNLGSFSRVGVIVSIGSSSLFFRAAQTKKGMANFDGEFLELQRISLPADLRQVPDVFVYLCRAQRDRPESYTPFAFARIAAATLSQEHFAGRVQWVHMGLDHAHNIISSFEFPGTVLMRLGFGRDETANEASWDTACNVADDAGPIAMAGGAGMRSSMAPSAMAAKRRQLEEDLEVWEDTAPACLRVHLFGAQDLPAFQDTALLDPYVKVRFMGSKQKSRVHKATCDPAFYETLEFNEMVPRELSFSAEVLIEIWDGAFGNHNQVSMVRVPVNSPNTLVSDTNRMPGAIENPIWLDLFDSTGEISQGHGRILFRLQLIWKGTARQTLPHPPPVVPVHRQAHLELICMGIRDLQQGFLRNATRPVVQFEVISNGERITLQTPTPTAAQRSATTGNITYAFREVYSIALPDDADLSPCMTIKVIEQGVRGQILGTARVDMSSKIPWSDNYQRPQQDKFAIVSEATKKRDARQKRKEQRAKKEEARRDAAAQAALNAELGIDPPEEKQKGGHRHEDSDNTSDTDTDTDSDDGSSDSEQGKRSKKKDKASDNQPAAGGSDTGSDDDDASGDGGGDEEDGGADEAGGGGGGGHRSQGADRRRKNKKKKKKQKAKLAFDPRLLKPNGALREGIGRSSVTWATGEAGLEVDSSEAAAVLAAARDVDRSGPLDVDEMRRVVARQQYEDSRGLYKWLQEDQLGDDTGEGVWGPAVNGPTWQELPALTAQGDEDTERAPLLFGADEDEDKDEGRGLLSRLLKGSSGWDNLASLHDMEDLTGLIAFPTTWASSEFSEGRDDWIRTGGLELEGMLKTAPFETYELFRGTGITRKRLFSRQAPTKRKVGVVKALVIVHNERPHPRMSDYVDMNTLRGVRNYVVRLYVIKGINLQPKDASGTSDPYIKVDLGKQHLHSKDDVQWRTLNPDFYKMFEFQTQLPGDSQLHIRVFDHDRFSSDDIIGETVIDLENRFWHREWKELGTEPPIPRTGPRKPLEYRSLMLPTSATPQGSILLWLEILDSVQARMYLPEEIGPPDKLEVEIRIVVWRAQDVPAMDEFEGLSDLYAVLWLEANNKDRHDTDTHWRARGGKASWNYRIILTTELPIKTPEFGRLKLQLWDKDVIKWNDIVAEAHLDLYKWLMMAYHRRESVKPFAEIKQAMERRKRMGEAADNPAGALDAENVEEDPADSGDDEVHSSMGDELDTMEAGGDVGDPLLGDGAAPGVGDKKKQKDGAQPAGGGADEQQPPQPPQAADESEFIASQVKSFLGYGDLPDDASWIKLVKHDREKGALLPMGEVAISVEILPSELAAKRPAGQGRNDPNQNPYLPPPVGRLTFSWNPFSLLYQLCGAKGAGKILACCCCLICILVFYFAGNFITSWRAFFDGW